MSKKIVIAKFPKDENSNREHALRTICLDHPKTGEKTWYLSDGNHMYEMQCLKDTDDSSLFVDDEVISCSDMYVMTRIDPLYLLIAPLLSNRTYSVTTSNKPTFQPLHQLLSFDLRTLFLELKGEKIDLSLLCDIREIPGEENALYSLSDTKVVAWLEKKLQQVMAVFNEEAYDTHGFSVLHYSLGILSEYINDYFFQLLCKEHDISDTTCIFKLANKGRKRKITEISDDGDENRNLQNLEPPSKKFKSHAASQWSNNKENSNGNSNTSTLGGVGMQDLSLEASAKKKSAKKPMRTRANEKLAKGSTRGMKSMMQYFNKQ